MSFLKKGKKQSLRKEGEFRVKRKKGELPSWFPNDFLLKEGDEVSNPNHPNPDWKNKKVKLTKEEFSMYQLIKKTETELRYYSEYYSHKDLTKMNMWFHEGLRWFMTTNPYGYMRLLD